MKWLIGDPMCAVSLVAAAALLGLSFQTPALTPLSWLGLAAIALLLRAGDCNILPAYVAGVVFQLTGVFWMTNCYSTGGLTDARVTNWLLLALYFGSFFPIVLVIGTRIRYRWPMWLLLPVIWTVGDLLRFEGGRFIGGPCPWLALGYSQTGFIAGCQVADLGGVWAVGFLAAMFGGMIADVLFERRLPAVPAIVLVAAVGYGLARIGTSDFSIGPTVALMPGRDKHVPDADLALWPESAFVGHETLSASCATVQGCLRYEGEKTFNSAVIDVQGSTICYDKCNLVPYSEANITSGNSVVSFQSGGYDIGVSICYDTCFQSFMRRLSDCDLILVPANESSDPTMMLADHLLAMSKLRAIEMRRPIVRNANGGYSGVIDGNGRTQPLAITSPTLVRVPIDDRFSLYAYVGQWLPIACVITVLWTVCRRPRLQGVPQARGNVVNDESNGAVAQ